MRFAVNVGIVAGCEGLAALQAFPHRLAVLDNYAVACDVLVQSGLLRKAFRALRALVRLFRQMRHHVTLQGVAVGEAFVAHFAYVRSIFAVSANVHPEHLLILEQLAALQARDTDGLAVVSLVVVKQLQLLAKSYLAKFAVQRFRALMKLHVKLQPLLEGERRVAYETFVRFRCALHVGLALVTVQGLLGAIEIHACAAFQVSLPVS